MNFCEQNAVLIDSCLKQALFPQYWQLVEIINE